jgi:hypothetical protein
MNTHDGSLQTPDDYAEQDEERGKRILPTLLQAMPTRRGERAMSDLERSEWARLLGRLADKYGADRVVRYIRQGLSSGLFQRIRAPKDFGNFVAEVAVDPSERGWQPTRNTGRMGIAIDRAEQHHKHSGQWPDEVRHKVMSECYADLTTAAMPPDTTDEQHESAKRSAKVKAWYEMNRVWGKPAVDDWAEWRKAITAEVQNRQDWQHMRIGGEQ